MADLVTYEHKLNEANGEDNRDGESHNRNWNCGVEGPSDDPAVQALRARQVRNHLATLLLSTGVPMLTAGDELGRTQRGNNNAYCQDNEISWMDWEKVDEDLLAFVSRLVALRRTLTGAPPGGVLRGPRDPRHGAARHRRHPRPRLVRTGRRAADDGGLVRHRPADPRHVPRRPRDPAPRCPGPAAGRRLLPRPAARRAGSGDGGQLPGPPWADGYELVLSTEYPTGAPPATTMLAPGRSSCPAAASGCSGSCAAP